MTTNNITTEFKKAVKERINNSSLSFLYQKLFFEFFISEDDLEKSLKYYQVVFIKDPDDWFRQFHKSIRNTYFFEGEYIKIVDTLTDEERKRRNEIIDIRMKFRRNNKTEQPPHLQELQNLNGLMSKQEDVPVAGIADAFLYNLICIDEKNELLHAMEIAFKICS